MLDEKVLRALEQMVGWPTESGTPNRPLIDWVADHAAAYGGRVTVVDGPDGRANLLASWGPEGDGGLMLSGHTDVVPAGDGWTTNPYTATIAGDGSRIVGRGTADMKGFIACALTTLEDLDRSSLKRPLHLALSYDEEVGCVGVRSLLERMQSGAARVRPDLVLIGEPTMMRPRHAHLGKVAFRVVFTADPAHSSLSPWRPNAISASARVIAAIDAVCAAHATEATTDASGETNAVLTTNVGLIQGGTALNVLAERCQLTFEVRSSVAFDPDAVLAPVWDAIADERTALARAGGGVEVTELTRYPALDTASSEPVVRLVERIADRGPSSPIGYGTEGGLFAAALGVPVVICGPGDIADAHRPAEFVTIEQLTACSTFLRQAITALCIDG